MRSGARLYTAVAVWIIVAPALVATMLWAPGIVVMLQTFGLDFLADFARALLSIAIVGLFFISAWTARGTYHVREHVTDMALWAVLFLGIVLVRNA